MKIAIVAWAGFCVLMMVLLYRWRVAGDWKAKIARLQRKRAKITERIASIYGGGTRCPNCFRWPWDCEKLPVWRYNTQPAEMECQECGHTSYWIDGPGIMISVTPPQPPVEIG